MIPRFSGDDGGHGGEEGESERGHGVEEIGVEEGDSDFARLFPDVAGFETGGRERGDELEMEDLRLDGMKCECAREEEEREGEGKEGKHENEDLFVYKENLEGLKDQTRTYDCWR